MADKIPVLTKTETELFEIINRTWDHATRNRWEELVSLRDNGNLTGDQRSELIQLGDELENLTIRRFEAIHELAKSRGVEFSSLCKQLDITPE